jgi:hypothetical protein
MDEPCLSAYVSPHALHRHSWEDVLGDRKDSGFNFAIGRALHVRRPALALSWISRQSQFHQRFAPLVQPLRGLGWVTEERPEPFFAPTDGCRLQ